MSKKKFVVTSVILIGMTLGLAIMQAPTLILLSAIVLYGGILVISSYKAV